MQPTRTRSTRLALLSILVLGSVFISGPANAQTVSTTADGNGSFSRNVTVSPNAAEGEYELVAKCRGPVRVYPFYPISSTSLPTSRALVVSDNIVAPGDTIGTAGTGCTPGASVSYSLNLIRLLRVAQVIEGDITFRARIFVVRDAVDPGFGLDDLNGLFPGGGGTIQLPGTVLPGTVVTPPTGTPVVGGSVAPPTTPQVIVNNNNNNNNNNSASAAASAGGGVLGAQTLARTGADALPLAAAGMATLLLGFVFLTAGNRNRPEYLFNQ